MRRACIHRLLLLLLLLLVCESCAQLEASLASVSPSTPQPARARIKAKTENISALASNAGDSFNIRHSRSRAHMLYNNNNNNNNNNGSTRLTLVSDGSLLRPLQLQTPTQQPTTGATAAVTHKIRKLHKKKINESIRKSVDKSLGVVREVKNHRSLAEAEHLQGRPTDVDEAALSEVMQLADEIDLENSLESTYQNVVVEHTSGAVVRNSGSQMTAGRQFVRADANYENSEEDQAEAEAEAEAVVDVDADDDELLSTTQMATFAPRQPTANGQMRSSSWQQTRVAGRTRLLPVNHSGSASLTGAHNVNLAADSADADYQLMTADKTVPKTENEASAHADSDTDTDVDVDVDRDDNEDATEADATHSSSSNSNSSGNSTEYAEADAHSQAITSQQEENERLEVNQINFNFESESDSESMSESDPVLDTSEVTMDDGYPPEVLIDDSSKQLVIGDVEGAGEGDGVDSNQITADVINARDNKIDLVSKFLQYIEQQHLMGSNCVAGTSLNLGEGVVDRYAQDRFRVEAEVAVNRANMLTR
ncbi:GH21226 [Drosophila grimshawi]|uniref:GH21226 n=3 Tax=Drosophila grimshawi TaxID=7222 RepID=B4J7E4_DROGR|nr:GH21226 [Drosophila grimshawi]